MKKTQIFAALLAAGVSGSLLAQTLVTVNGSKIDSSEIDRQVKILQSSGQIQGDSPALRADLLDRQVMRTLIAQEARRLKLDQSAEFKQASDNAMAEAKKQGADKKAGFKQEWADYQNDLLNQAYMYHIVSQNPVSDAEVRQVYDQLKARYSGTDEVQLGDIITDKKADAEQAISELKAKKSFAEVAAKYSADKQNTLSPNFEPLKDLQDGVPTVYNAVKDLKKGQFTAQPVTGNNGVYAVFYVNDRRAFKVPTFDEAKVGLSSDLNQQLIMQAVNALAQKATITPAK
ncbi:MAG: peptidyl-prolyl cis-trans isomerase [Neisseria sp.]|nr:peptidyl-prolyl cis-trans isomerase [Neisseria sp.]